VYLRPAYHQRVGVGLAVATAAPRRSRRREPIRLEMPVESRRRRSSRLRNPRQARRAVFPDEASRSAYAYGTSKRSVSSRIARATFDLLARGDVVERRAHIFRPRAIVATEAAARQRRRSDANPLATMVLRIERDRVLVHVMRSRPVRLDRLPGEPLTLTSTSRDACRFRRPAKPGSREFFGTPWRCDNLGLIDREARRERLANATAFAAMTCMNGPP